MLPNQKQLSQYRIERAKEDIDFFIVSKEEAEEQYHKAAEFLNCVWRFLEI